MTPSQTITLDEAMLLAIEHGIGRPMKPLGLDTGDVLGIDNGYYTGESTRPRPVCHSKLTPLTRLSTWQESAKAIGTTASLVLHPRCGKGNSVEPATRPTTKRVPNPRIPLVERKAAKTHTCEICGNLIITGLPYTVHCPPRHWTAPAWPKETKMHTHCVTGVEP